MIPEAVIAPIPFHTFTTVTVNSEENRMQSVRLFDATGNLAFSKRVRDRTFVLKRKILASGLYYLEIAFSNNQTQTRKLVIK